MPVTDVKLGGWLVTFLPALGKRRVLHYGVNKSVLASGKCCLPLMHRGGLQVWKCEKYCWLAGSCTVLSEESHGLVLHFLFLAQTQRSHSS